MGKFGGFQSVQLVKPKRSDFDLSNIKRITARMGDLIPILALETMPGDKFRIDSEMIVRLQALLAPIFDQILVYVHFFFVPYRLVWRDWEQFITGGRLGVGVDPITAPITPRYNISQVQDYPQYFAKGSVADYLGVPLSIIDDEQDYSTTYIDIIPFGVYQLIWMQYYRDRNYIPDSGAGIPFFPMLSGVHAVGEDIAAYCTMRTRDYMKDYFTSALPFTQRGDEVLLPTGTDINYMDVSRVFREDGSNPSADSLLSGTATGELLINDAIPANGRVENIESIGSGTINDFRTAYALQVWLERNAVGGSRYTESIQAHFAVRPQDYRLQRPEYIGGGRIPVKISEVVSTAWSVDNADQSIPTGNLSGHGITFGNTNRASYFCSEHGMVMGILSIMAEGSYHQGLPRMFFARRSFLDYPWPTFAKLGEQEIHKAEIYLSAENLTPVDGSIPLFGYTSRYADWKYIPNSNHADFHDTYMYWCLTREFSSSPELGATFVNFDQTTQDRIFAVAGTRNFLLYIHNRVHVTRALPYFGTPNTMGFV